MTGRSSLTAGALLGLTGVALGAFGTHALKATLQSKGYLDVWETGVRYQLVHAVSLVALAGWLQSRPGAWAGWAARLWTVGIVLFSGSLYGLALGLHELWPLTPAGGVLLLAGWAALVPAGLDRRG